MSLSSNLQQQEKSQSANSTSAIGGQYNISEWQIQDVCKFLSHLLPKRQLDITKQVLKHHINGLDLLELNEKNLIEIGITIIHERKKVLRQIKILKNHTLNNYGHILVKYFDSTLQIERSLKFKISESKIKVKHILIQAYQIFKQKKCDVSQYCLVQLTNKDSKAILPNNTLITDLISPYKIEEFMITKTQQYLYQQEKEETNSTCSPIRIIRSDVDNSLERLISSPAQTIYVQPSDENDEVVQLNQSCSESQMQMNTDRQHNRNNSKSSTKLSQKSNSKLNRKSKIMQQSVYQQNNKDQGVNQSTSNYLQNYITSNRQSHKKQPSSSSSNIIPITHFQVKKHSVNDTAFNYNGQIAQNQVQSNTGSTSTNTNTGGVNSLSRGNSMKKMKTFCNGSTGSNPAQTNSYQNQNTKPGSSLGQTSNHPQVSGFNKQTKKVVHKGGKSVNMYSTLNGQSQPQNVLKKSQPKEAHRDMIKENFRDNAFVKIIQEDYNQTTRNEKTPAQSRQLVRENLVQSNQAKPHGSMKQSFTSNQDQALIFNKQHSQQHQQQTIQERPQINNLNEIFSDFLDEQSQIQSSSQTKGKFQSKVRAESLHSRQQVLLEEDSLENMKKLPEQYNHGYLQTEQYNSGLQDSQSISGSQATQRAIKHMAHKSMYALNSNQSRLGNQKKSLGQISQSGKNQNGQGQHFGTFDNSHAFYNHQYAITTMSECPNYDNLVLTENYNICNINNANTGANINDNMSSSKQNQQQHSLRLNTEMDITNKENINNQRENFDGLGKRGGTMGYTANVRSDSNPAKHRNNRYSDQQDDLLMLDMSEEESVLINKRF